MGGKRLSFLLFLFHSLLIFSINRHSLIFPSTFDLLNIKTVFFLDDEGSKATPFPSEDSSQPFRSEE